ncbi:MAG TPA: hypothetical protein VMP01_19030 [Pirellulaceae bacterium]|nr:hypothetical protein [Pirellulaceae bacterium]
MDEILQAVGMAFVLPAGAALAAGWLAGKFLPASARSFSAAAAFAVAYCAGSLLLRRWSELVPTRHFHWPFYLALAGAVLGALAATSDPQRGFRWRWQLLAAILAAIVLVPTYPALSPPRWVQVPLVAGYLFLLAAGLMPLSRRVAPAALAGFLSLSALTVGVLTAGLVNLSHGMGALMAAGALAGCCAALWRVPRPQGAAALAVCYALVVGGWAYIGARESSPRLWGSLAAALAPLALWVLEAPPLAKIAGIWKTIAQWAIVSGVLGAAVAWGVLTVR